MATTHHDKLRLHLANTLLLSAVLLITACADSVTGNEEELELPDEIDFIIFEGDTLNPAPHIVYVGAYEFNFWDEDRPDGAFPDNMLFLMTTTENDPGLGSVMNARYTIPENDYAGSDSQNIGFPYRNESRTRINGLGEDGIGIINTGRNRELGDVVLALNTQGMHQVDVRWTGGTLRPNSRIYNLRMQYRVGMEEAFQDVLVDGEPVEYQRHNDENHVQDFGPIRLPEAVNDQEYVQIRWKYYHTGERISEDSGARAMLRLDNIRVEGAKINP